MAQNGFLQTLLILDDDAVSEYFILPPKLSRLTRTLNQGVQNKFQHTSLCLETQRRKFRTYHSVETTKHHNALLTFRKNLKYKPWRSDSATGDSKDVLAADISNLSPVDHSRFQLVRRVVASLPGEKVSMEKVCGVMRQLGRVYTEDKNGQAVPVLNPRLHHRTYPRSSKAATGVENCDQTEIQTKASPVPEQTLETPNVTAVAEYSLAESLPSTEDHVNFDDGKDFLTRVETSCTPSFSQFGELSVKSEMVESSTEGDCRSGSPLSERSSVQSQKVFFTEINYIPLKKVGGKKTFKVRKDRPNNPLGKTPQKSTSVKKDDLKSSSYRSIPDQTKQPLIRKTDPYGISYKGGSVDQLKSMKSGLLGNLALSENSADITERIPRPPSRLSSRPPSRSLSRGSSRQSSRSFSHNLTNTRADMKGKNLVPGIFAKKSISWKEPLATTEVLVDWENKPGFERSHGKLHGTNKTLDSRFRERAEALQSQSLPSIHRRNVQIQIRNRTKGHFSLRTFSLHQSRDSVCRRKGNGL